MYLKTVLAAGLAALAFGFGAQPAVAQSFHAGLSIEKLQTEEPTELALFYPTQASPMTWNLGPYSLDAAMRATPAEKLKGLILLSHGTGGSELGHHNLATSLARDGYLVAALRHPRDNWRDRSLIQTSAYFSERPKQVSRVLDALLADPRWKDRIAPDRIGAIGHSAGGFTVLALAGGVADPSRLVAHCGQGSDDPGFCTLGPRSKEGANDALARPKPSDFDVRDKRIRAVVAMAPVGIVFAPESLARIAIPVKIIAAEKDKVLQSKYHGAWLKERMPLAEFEEVENAGHFAFMSPMSISVPAAAGNPNEDPPGFDRRAFQQRLAQDVVDFFGRHLQ